MVRRLLIGLVLLAAATAGPGLRAHAPGSSQNFALKGHNPLYGRGMNAAPAVYDHYVYVGNRTDGSPHHPHPGVLVVDVADPANPAVVGEIGPPNEGNISETSRELRVWPQQGLLLVMNFGCSAAIHSCVATSDVTSTVTPTIKFYDVAANAVSPPLIASYTPRYITDPSTGSTSIRTPHEMFLWVDPATPSSRALLFLSTPTSATNRPNLIVTDISGARGSPPVFTQVATWIGNDLFTADDRNASDVRLHSIGVSKDGTRTYLAYLGGGFLVLDTSALADNDPNTSGITLATPVANRVSWGNPGAHSAVKVPGKPYALVTDEVYGDALDPITGDNHGCPWGWLRMVDITDEAHPVVASEFKTDEDTAAFCSSLDGQNPLNTYFTSFSSHNPTVLGDLAFVTWHSAGLQAIDLSDPASPSSAGFYLPAPLSSVATDDPALSLGNQKVVMWSYPIIKDGLIYVVDIRNGLYILEYTDPDRRAAVDAIGFLEGNSNLGDALTLPF